MAGLLRKSLYLLSVPLFSFDGFQLTSWSICVYVVRVCVTRDHRTHISNFFSIPSYSTRCMFSIYTKEPKERKQGRREYTKLMLF